MFCGVGLGFAAMPNLTEAAPPSRTGRRGLTRCAVGRRLGGTQVTTILDSAASL
jgi:hypothetical protein